MNDRPFSDRAPESEQASLADTREDVLQATIPDPEQLTTELIPSALEGDSLVTDGHDLDELDSPDEFEEVETEETETTETGETRTVRVRRPARVGRALLPVASSRGAAQARSLGFQPQDRSPNEPRAPEGRRQATTPKRIVAYQFGTAHTRHQLPGRNSERFAIAAEYLTVGMLTTRLLDATNGFEHHTRSERAPDEVLE